MNFTGVFIKMQSELAKPIQYYLDTDSDFIQMNQLLSKNIQIQHTGYQCFNCGLDKPIFRMGYCKSCFFEVPATAEFVLKPEHSKAHLGIEERDLEWEKKVQLQPHIVYLANTGGLKVGVTRKTQIPTRWIDQGANEAIPIVEVENRYLAGITEVALAEHVSDKTNYRKMLSATVPNIDLFAEREKLLAFVPNETKNAIIEEPQELELEFPVLEYPVKINSITLSKNPEFSGKLMGIKGQYWIFEDGKVFNVRNHEGYTFSLALT